jgi:hypothetical protein
MILKGLLKFALPPSLVQTIPCCRPSSCQKLRTPSRLLAKRWRRRMISSIAPTGWLAGFGKQTGSGSNLETWQISPAQRSSPCANWRASAERSSPSAHRDHLNSVDRNDADMAGPRGVRLGESVHKRRETLGIRGMKSEQNDTGLRQWAAALNCNLPEVLVERQHDSCFGLREIQQGDVACSGEIRASPPSTLESGTLCIRGRDSWRATDRRGCPLASGQGSW